MALSPDQFGEPEQLRMFMSAREIHSGFAPGDRRGEMGPGADARIWARKLGEARDDGLVASVRSAGVQKPVELLHSEQAVIDGHHRVAAAMNTNPDQLVPVIHHARERDWMHPAVDRAWRALR